MTSSPYNAGEGDLLISSSNLQWLGRPRIGNLSMPGGALPTVVVATPGVLDGVSALTTLESSIGRTVQIAQIYQPWGADAAVGSYAPTWNSTIVNALIARGSIPLITWEPKGVTTAINAADATTISGGSWNTYIDSWITGIKAVAPSLIYLRPFHEMNDAAQSWGVGGSGGNTAAEIVAAWQFIVNRFAAQSCTNVRWIWSVNEVTWEDQVDGLAASCYPGNSYVDIVAFDAYNWGTDRLTTGGWRSPRQVMARSIAVVRAIAPAKTLWVTETSSSPNGGTKDEWIKGLAAYLRAQSSVGTACWFNYDNSGSGEADWRCTTPAETLTAYRALIQGQGSSASYPVTPTATAPNIPATPRLWFEADSGTFTDTGGTTPTTNGTRVARWNNQGNGGNVTQSTSGVQPLYQTNQINGLPALTFTSARDDVLLNTSLTWAAASAAMTIIMVMRVPSYAAGTFNGIMGFAGSSGDDNSSANGLALIAYADAAALLAQRKIVTNELDFGTDLPAGTWRVVTLRVGSGAAHVRINGLHATADAYDSVANFVPVNVAIGSRLVGNFPYNSADSEIAAAVAYDSALAEETLAGVEQYLLNKYGL